MKEIKTDKNLPALGDVLPTPAGQLSKLSSVLNGLEQGASAMHRHVVQATTAVKSGTYAVDASAVSRRIVGESVASGSRLRSVRKAARATPDVRSGAEGKPGS